MDLFDIFNLNLRMNKDMDGKWQPKSIEAPQTDMNLPTSKYAHRWLPYFFLRHYMDLGSVWWISKDTVSDDIWWCPDYQEVPDMAFMEIDGRDF